MKITRIIILTFALAVTCFAQEAKWTRIEFEKNLFSAAFPPEMIVDAEKIEGTQKLKLWSFAEEMQVNLVVYKYDRPKEYLKNLRVGGTSESEQTEIGDVYARKFLFAKNGYYSAQIYLAAKKALYYFSFTSNKADNPKLARFLNSVKTNGKIIFPAEKTSPEEAENTLTDAEIKSTSEVVTAINRVPNNLKANYEIDRVTRSMNVIEKRTTMTRLPIILREAKAKSDKLKGQMVVVRIQLLATGDTGEVAVFSDADDKAIFAAVEAVRSMKFLPAQLKGKNIDSYYVLLYNGEIGDGSSTVLQ
jgi:hypothetical protein